MATNYSFIHARIAVARRGENCRLQPLRSGSMALKSMTGFSRCDGGSGNLNWHWEMRTVNGKGLDIRLRLPPGYERLEQRARDACNRALSRGNCTITLSLKQAAGGVRITLNEEAFKQVAEAANAARSMIEASPPSLDGLLAIRGVMEFSEDEPDEAEAEARAQAMMDDLEQVLADVVEARRAEGDRLTSVIAAQIDEIEQLTARIEAAPGRTPEAIRQRLSEQLARLLEEGSALDAQRLHQEAALLAAKADIQEEIERLKVHVEAARELLDSDEPVGRRLEFLSQEFNREANTICSKANDTEISQGGLALKAVIDRLREQVQNIE
jgi:uncharacterized protein (TIGR00255 family)